IRRNLSLKIFDWGKVEEAGGNKVRQRIGLRRCWPERVARRITKRIRDDFPKCKSQIQGDAVRVSAKSRDDLQRVIARLREEAEGYPVAIQFENYRSRAPSRSRTSWASSTPTQSKLPRQTRSRSRSRSRKRSRNP